MGLGRDLFAADGDQILGPADHARERAADLQMRDRAHGLQLEHKVEGRHLERANMRQPQHIGHVFDRGPGQPPLLLLRAPQKRDDGAGLPPLGVFGDLRLSPSEVRRREGKTGGLFGVKAAKHVVVYPGLIVRWRVGKGGGLRRGYL